MTPTQTISLSFFQGSFKIIFAHAIFKATIKGKKTLNLAQIVDIADSFSKGDCDQSPQSQ